MRNLLIATLDVKLYVSNMYFFNARIALIPCGAITSEKLVHGYYAMECSRGS